MLVVPALDSHRGTILARLPQTVVVARLVRKPGQTRVVPQTRLAVVVVVLLMLKRVQTMERTMFRMKTRRIMRRNPTAMKKKMRK
jgi:hypothetical protein